MTRWILSTLRIAPHSRATQFVAMSFSTSTGRPPCAAPSGRGAFADKETAAAGGGYITRKGKVEVTRPALAFEDHNHAPLRYHFERSVVKSAAAHAFGRDAGGLFEVERAGASRAERKTPADEEKVFDTFKLD